METTGYLTFYGRDSAFWAYRGILTSCDKLINATGVGTSASMLKRAAYCLCILCSTLNLPALRRAAIIGSIRAAEQHLVQPWCRRNQRHGSLWRLLCRLMI